MFDYKTSGFYVDVGCHHPVRVSNTYLLYSVGWRGLVIDADLSILSDFAESRPDDQVVHSGVGHDKGKRTFHIFEDHALNTFDKTVAEYWKTLGQHPEETDVDIQPLSHILKDSKVSTSDFLNIDIEGLDLEALETNDWSKWTPEVVAIEDHKLNLESPSESEIFRFMKERGYYLVSKVLYTAIYSRHPVRHAAM